MPRLLTPFPSFVRLCKKYFGFEFRRSAEKEFVPGRLNSGKSHLSANEDFDPPICQRMQSKTEAIKMLGLAKFTIGHKVVCALHNALKYLRHCLAHCFTSSFLSNQLIKAFGTLNSKLVRKEMNGNTGR